MSTCSGSNSCWVLLVDDDWTCLYVLEQMLLSYSHEVTKFQCPKKALAYLRENKDMFDLLLSGVQDEDGVSLVQTARLEFNMPVVLMLTSDSSQEVTSGGILDVASLILAKPVQREALQPICRLVESKQRNGCSSLGSSQIQGSVNIINSGRVSPEIVGSPVDKVGAAAAQEGSPTCSNPKALRTRKAEKEEEEEEEGHEEISVSSDQNHTTAKKSRFIWTSELHRIFVDAVNGLTEEKVVPKKILEYMKNKNVSNITRENVASHLQKYRSHLKNLENDHELDKHLPSHLASVDLSKESNLKQSSLPDQTYCIQNNSSSFCFTAHLPQQTLTQHKAQQNQSIDVLPPFDQTHFMDQKPLQQPSFNHGWAQQQLTTVHNTGWDFLGGMLTNFLNLPAPTPHWAEIMESQENDLAIQYLQPPPEPLEQVLNEGKFSANFSLPNEQLLHPPMLSNQCSNIDGNSVVTPIEGNCRYDIFNDYLEDCENKYGRQTFENLQVDCEKNRHVYDGTSSVDITNVNPKSTRQDVFKQDDHMKNLTPSR